MAAELAEKFVLAFKDVSWKFFRAVYLSWVQVKFKGKRKKIFFSHMPWFKRLCWF